MKRLIQIKFQNGLTFDRFKNDVFKIHNLTDEFDFEESNKPDFIIFGPYGNDLPKISKQYKRIGYFCENITPDLSICEWAFGIPLETQINSPKYKRIQWHGLDPNSLIKRIDDNEIDRIINTKNKFCNFLYSNAVPYREKFFEALSKYKRIDAPGKSMNNMPSIDTLFNGNIWERKRKFISDYKFTIAFENYSAPGYQTEKLYDALLTNSLPIYCGDPHINNVFNTKSIFNAFEILEPNYPTIVQQLEKYSQMDFKDILPQYFTNVRYRLKRKIKSFGRELKMKIEFNNLNYKALVEKIIEIDSNEDLYIQMLKEPWLNNNIIPDNTFSKNRWIEIFK